MEEAHKEALSFGPLNKIVFLFKKIYVNYRISY